MSLGWVGQEGVDVVAFDGQMAGEQLSYCENAWAMCTPTPSACGFTGICNNCQPGLNSVFLPCCAMATPEPCFASILSSVNAPSTTDPNLVACSTAITMINNCESATSGFTDLDNGQQASCLCYDSNGSYEPSAYDTPYSSCAAWAQTADTSDFPGISSGLGMCASLGNVANAVSATATSSAYASTSAGTAANTAAAQSGSVASATPASNTAAAQTPVATTPTTTQSSGGVHQVSVRGLSKMLLVFALLPLAFRM